MESASAIAHETRFFESLVNRDLAGSKSNPD
jgi:hypothetical protein